MLKLPQRPIKNPPHRQILFIYGSHASIERIAGVAEYLTQFGDVTLPDLPGCGGMDSLYQIGRVASLDELGDYLVWFIDKHLPPDCPIDLIGMSLGFAVVTRMLQNHPELTTRVNILVSYVGTVDCRDLNMKPATRRGLVAATWLFERRPLAWLMRRTFCTRPVLWLVYRLGHNQKFVGRDFRATLDMEVKLWQSNDVRTYCRTIRELFTLRDARPINHDLIHINVGNDKYVNHHATARSMKKMFRRVRVLTSPATAHSFSVIADAGDAARLMPAELVEILGQ
jgi:pimeloyl-ACP methyl ester carboxylesterase